MPRVTFTPHLRKHLRCDDQVVEGRTVRELLDAMFVANPPLRGYLVDDQGRLRQHVAIFVGSTMIADRIRQSDPVPEAGEVYIFQALSGG